MDGVRKESAADCGHGNGMSYLGRGSVRRGGALLPGLFRCARCGRKLQVSYGGSKNLLSALCLPRGV